MAQKRMTTLANATLPELLAAECEHLVARHFPIGTKASRPEGGFMSWLELPRGCDGERLFWSAREAGISIIPGSVFSLSTGLERFIRLSAASRAARRRRTCARRARASAARSRSRQGASASVEAGEGVAMAFAPRAR